MKVHELMCVDLVTLTEDDTLAHAEQCMRRGRIRHLPVIRGSQLVGLVTHRDLLAASFSMFAEIGRGEQRRVFSTIFVKDLMHQDVVTVSPELPVAEAARLLLRSKFGCLPVVNDHTDLVGIITEADFLRLTVRLLP